MVPASALVLWPPLCEGPGVRVSRVSITVATEAQPKRGLSRSPLPSPAGKGNAHSRAFRELVKLHRISSGRKPRVYFKRFQHPRQLWL